RPRRPGLGPLGLLGTVVAFGGLVVVLLASLVSISVALTVLVPLALFLGPLALRTADGRNVYQLVAIRIGWLKRKAECSHTYVSGPLTRLPVVNFSPPGMLPRVMLLNGTYAYGSTFC
ncbi:SCO6880 family protein, partial [Streptomyces sp. SP18CM02]|uniref:SCO6880 family protein n=1 Tax=Streptomyces sp. SP18CM02 TaxID=2758571 RepID=UPI0019B068CE